MDTLIEVTGLGKTMEGFRELTLELADKCPLRCLHCSSNAGLDCANRLPRDTVIRLIDEATAVGASKICLSGGEPTIAEAFLPAVSHAVRSGVALEVFTCGVAVVGQSLRSFPDETIEYCKRIGGVKFIFSLHGATSDVHDLVTQTPGSFDILMESLAKSLSAGIMCEANFVPLKVNLHQFSDVVDLVDRVGAGKLSVLRFVPQGRGYQNRHILELSIEEEDSFVRELLRLRSEREREIRTGSPFNGVIPDNHVPCRAGFGKLVVQANGNVLPCEVYKHHKRSTWQLSVHNQRLSEILSSDRIIRLSESIRRTQCLMCPIHSTMRLKKTGEINYAFPEPTVHA